ncbi:hypothetical protein [Salibacterium sp. K-3]
MASKKITALMMVLLVLAGCKSMDPEALGNPSPKDYLEEDGADIFMLDGVVYSNAEGVDWVEDTDYKIQAEKGNITKQSDRPGGFDDGTANKLPVGTTIYQTNSQVYVAVAGEKEIPYLKMVEG